MVHWVYGPCFLVFLHAGYSAASLSARAAAVARASDQSSITLSSLAPETLPEAVLFAHPSSFLLCFSSAPPSSLLLFYLRKSWQRTDWAIVHHWLLREQLFQLSNTEENAQRTNTPKQQLWLVRLSPTHKPILPVCSLPYKPAISSSQYASDLLVGL